MIRDPSRFCIDCTHFHLYDLRSDEEYCDHGFKLLQGTESRACEFYIAKEQIAGLKEYLYSFCPDCAHYTETAKRCALNYPIPKSKCACRMGFRHKEYHHEKIIVQHKRSWD
jgi:hypothetical protein